MILFYWKSIVHQALIGPMNFQQDTQIRVCMIDPKWVGS